MTASTGRGDDGASSASDVADADAGPDPTCADARRVAPPTSPQVSTARATAHHRARTRDTTGIAEGHATTFGRPLTSLRSRSDPTDAADYTTSKQAISSSSHMQPRISMHSGWVNRLHGTHCSGRQSPIFGFSLFHAHASASAHSS